MSTWRQPLCGWPVMCYSEEMLRETLWLVPLTLMSFTQLACDEDASSTGSGGDGATDDGAANGVTTGPGAGGASTSSSTGTQSSTGTGANPTSFAEMCAAPGVVFCDAFEGQWDATWMEDGGDVSIIQGGAIAGEGTSVIELSTHGNIQSSKLLRTFPAADRIHVRFDVQYDGEYDNSGGSHGLILGGSDSPPWGMFGTAGMKPNGSDYFVLNFEPNGLVGQGGEFGFYAYFFNMQPDGHGDYWGNVFGTTQPTPALVSPGAWQCAEFSLALNDPGSQNGSADFWLEGVHQGTFSGLEWRTDPNLRITTFALDSYNHMRNGPIPDAQPNLVRYDNFVISTEPVGCL